MIKSKKKDFAWTAKNMDRMDKIKKVIVPLEEYFPLTLGQIFYLCVANKIYEGNRSDYVGLSRLLKFARIDGYLPWDCIEDRGREFGDIGHSSNIKEFIEEQTCKFLSNYKADLQHDMMDYIEVWIDKENLIRMFESACHKFSVPVVATKGHPSITLIKAYADRVSKHPEKRNLILFFSDCTPTGVGIGKAISENMKKHFETEVGVERCALTEDQIKKFKIQSTDLESLRPDILKELVLLKMDEYFPESIVAEHEEKQDVEKKELRRIKQAVIRTITNNP